MMRWLPPAASSHAGEIDFVLTLVHVLMLVLFVGWSGVLPLGARAVSPRTPAAR